MQFRLLKSLNFNLCCTDFPVKHLQPNNGGKESCIVGKQQQPPPQPPSQPPLSSVTTAHDTSEMPTKRRRIAHLKNQTTVSEPTVCDAVSRPSTVPDAVSQPSTVPDVIEPASSTKKIISKIVNWGWNVDNNQLMPENREPSYKRIKYLDTTHWKKCVIFLEHSFLFERLQLK